MRVVGIRHRVKTALGEWPAAPEAPQREQRPAASAVPRDSFVGVVRAGRMKLARASQKRPEKNLIQPDEREQEPSASR